MLVVQCIAMTRVNVLVRVFRSYRGKTAFLHFSRRKFLYFLSALKEFQPDRVLQMQRSFGHTKFGNKNKN
jgi:hypothetical protein